jgi:flagellar biosynthesis chaperone FliJ
VSKTDLTPLLRVRQSREELARRSLANQKQVLMQQSQVLEERRQELDHYDQWRQQQEHRLFRALTQSPVPPSELLSYHASMARLLAHQQQLGEALERQKAATREAEAALLQARINFHEKRRAAEKCRELVREENELIELKQRSKDDEELDEAALSQWISAHHAPNQETDE